MKQILNIDPAAASPIWRQIEEGVRRLVASGALQPGAAVQSVRDLSKTLRVNPATVSKAYQRLTEAGLLEVRRGEGTFVADVGRDRLNAERKRLLAAGAAEFVDLARGVGVSRDDALEIVDRSWDESSEGGQRKKQ